MWFLFHIWTKGDLHALTQVQRKTKQDKNRCIEVGPCIITFQCTPLKYRYIVRCRNIYSWYQSIIHSFVYWFKSTYKPITKYVNSNENIAKVIFSESVFFLFFFVSSEIDSSLSTKRSATSSNDELALHLNVGN